jgi:MYXO-CTERM domain-containing protein
MNRITNRQVGLPFLRLGLFALLAFASSGAMAATYNVIFKDAAGAALSCAVGGFTFNKSNAGTFATGGASATLTGCTFVPGIANGTYAPGAVNVVVENVTLDKPGTGGQNEPLNQGPNVQGLTGTLQFSTNAAGDCDGTGVSNETKTYTITFSYAAGSQNTAGRTYALTCAGPGSFATRTGNYHVQNTANPVPEPESLALALLGLGALALTRLRARRRG